MKNRSSILPALAVCAALVFTGCENERSRPATPITTEQFNALHEHKENAGKRLSITGYPYLIPTDINIHSDMKVMVYLYTGPKGSGTIVGGVRVDYKEQKNGMYIPDRFTPDDLIVYDNEGQQLGVTDKVTVSFTVALDTGRSPSESERVEAGEDGSVKRIPVKAYYGEGPEYIRIDKAR